MKPRFEKRGVRREARLKCRTLRRERDRHDRAWLFGAGHVFPTEHGCWRIVSGLWLVDHRYCLRCVTSGVVVYAGMYLQSLDDLRRDGWMVHDPPSKGWEDLGPEVRADVHCKATED